MPYESDSRIPDRLRLWSFREDVLVETDAGENRLLAVTHWGEFVIDNPGVRVRESLLRMTLGPVSLANVLPATECVARGENEDDCAEWTRLGAVLNLLSGSVVHSLGVDDTGGPLLSAVPTARHASFHLRDVGSELPIRLSRFTVMRASEGELVLESPLSRYRVVLHRPWAIWAVGSLGRATTVTAVATALGLDESIVAEIISYFVATGLVLLGEHDESSGAPRFAEDIDPGLIPWSHDDLLFHSRSRMGRNDDPHGAVIPYSDKLPRPPDVKAVPSGPRFPLHQPSLVELASADRPWTEVIESRRSYRTFSERELSAEQLGELLFRVTRVRSSQPASAGAKMTYEISGHPYPSAVGAYELELYLALDRCEGLERGNYHYDPEEHALTLINTSRPVLDDLLDTAKIAAGTMHRPAALITMTTRIAGPCWKDSGFDYATTLKHVGVLQQTLYLVATAMGLAPCALAVGDGEAATEAFGLAWPTEVCVGEFIVGVPPEAQSR